MAHTELDHVSVVADGLDRSVAFYEELFDVEPIPTPTSSSRPGGWR